MMQYNHNYTNGTEEYMKVTVKEGSSVDTSFITETFNWAWDGIKALWEMFWKWV